MIGRVLFIGGNLTVDRISEAWLRRRRRQETITRWMTEYLLAYEEGTIKEMIDYILNSPRRDRRYWPDPKAMAYYALKCPWIKPKPEQSYGSLVYELDRKYYMEQKSSR